MSDESEQSEAEDAERLPLAALITQLRDDATSFARAEVRYLQAQAGERLQIAVPALLMIAGACVLAIATMVALLVGFMLVLVPYIGAAFAVFSVSAVAVLLALLLYQLGRTRMSRLFGKIDW